MIAKPRGETERLGGASRGRIFAKPPDGAKLSIERELDGIADKVFEFRVHAERGMEVSRARMRLIDVREIR